jgi:toxin-antitoxin system PIN domain toxin
MLALDTNILVYAHREEFPQHGRALAALERLVTGSVPFGVPVFVLGEFLRVVTHPTFLPTPSSEVVAVRALDAVLSSPASRLLQPGSSFWSRLKEQVKADRIRGNHVLDAQIGAVCREHGINTLLTEDQRFPAPPGLRLTSLEEFSAAGP